MQHSSKIRGRPEHITITVINTLSLYDRPSVYEHYAREKIDFTENNNLCIKLYFSNKQTNKQKIT